MLDDNTADADDSPADRLARFERVVLPHLDAAHNLARWMTGRGHDAEDVVQEAYLRALRGFDSFRGGGGASGGSDGRCWLLTIVRNTCYTWLRRNREDEPAAITGDDWNALEGDAPAPDAALVRRADGEQVRRAIEDLPAAFREVVVLRELEGLSYQEIAGVIDLPLGTVMSRLARGRRRLQEALAGYVAGEK
jgi:RNA polymerase sigma-70 factor (ECF subfamily)